MSLVQVFDELARNSQILQNSCEEQFIRFVTNVEHNRKRWENAELECQRLNIELNKVIQDRQGLELKLENARNLLDTEVKVRKRAEAERDKLRDQLDLLRELIMDDQFSNDVKLNKIKSLGNVDYDPDDVFQSYANTPKGILKKRTPGGAVYDDTEDISIADIDDLSFDDTKDLCESRRRSQKRSRSRSRSMGRRHQEGEEGYTHHQEVVTPTTNNRQTVMGQLENIASPRNDLYNLRKRQRRSRSVVAFQQPPLPSSTTDTISTEEADPRPRSYSASANVNKLDQGFQESPSSTAYTTTNTLIQESCHTYTQKTVIKAEKCAVCQKRMGFGRVVLKCADCRVTLHKECVERGPSTCTPLHEGSPDVCRTPGGGVKRSASVKKPYFASPMLR